jgi:ribosomal protein S18 acetylase RimI-like enzyme
VAFTIDTAGAERLDELAPLWAQMQAHHESVAPDALTSGVAGFRDPDGSWARRRASYAEWFAAGQAVLHIARTRDRAVAGYAMVRLHSGGWAQLDTPEEMAEIESLSVSRAHRGRGIGSQLIHAVHTDLRARGIELLTLSVFAGNAPAARLYARFGMQPVLTTMIGRVAPAATGRTRPPAQDRGQASATRAGGGSGS